MLNQNMNQKQLLQWINEVSFAIIEIQLYLDTHPDDKEALAFFDYYNAEKKKAMALYATEFSPLTLDCVNNNSCHWHWISDPWPWEGGYC